MQEYKDIEFEYASAFYKRKELISTICDLCGRNSEGYKGWIDKDNNRHSINIHHGKYPLSSTENYLEEIDEQRNINIDMCHVCFENKLLPFMKENGLKRKYEIGLNDDPSCIKYEE